MEKSNPIISLSTSYLQDKFADDGYALLQEAAAMGFEYVELGHSTKAETLEGIIKGVEEGVVKVSSLHNFCPLPPYAKGAAPNLFSPATKSAIESEQWLRHTRNTLDFAKQFKARAVVCHCGTLSYFFFRPDAKLMSILEESGYEDLDKSNVYPKLLEKFKMRADKSSVKKDYPRIAANIAKLHDFAAENSIRFGLENREYYRDLPLEWNVESFFKALEHLPQTGFWHDVGHSRRKELAKVCTQIELAERTENLVIGWHLHDCTAAGKDHVAIGKGSIDFKKIAKFFKPEKHIFTLELNKAVERSDAIDSLKRVRDLMQ